jgi:hypothetical protein
MIQLVPMSVRVAFEFHGRALRPGDRIEAGPVEALALKYAGKADYVEPASAAPSPPRSKRRYRRRDLQAEG